MDSTILYKVPSQNNICFYDIYGNTKRIKKLLNHYDELMTSAIQEGNLDVLDILIDIKAALYTIEMSDKQKERIGLFMQGYKETEIGEILNIKRQSVEDSINSVCKKVYKELQEPTSCSV